jgi:putative membrane protein
MEVFEMDGPWQGNPSGYVHHDAWWGFLHLLPFVVLLVLIGVGFWAVLRYSSRPLMAAGTGGVGAPPRDAAVEELRIRYARGELGRDDFAQRMCDLGHPDIAPAHATAGDDDAPTSPEGDAPAGSG